MKRKSKIAAAAHAEKMHAKHIIRGLPRLGTSIQGKVYRNASVPGSRRRRLKAASETQNA